ncbi:MAG: endospore germination permease [Firmicutes bacterium]|nr:endospore germination permease [Bacillota bacterium]
MNRPRRITLLQATAVLISTVIGVGVLALPRFTAQSMDTGAPFLTVLGIGVGFVGLGLLTLLGMRFPNQTILEYSETILGKIPGRFGSLIVVLFFALLTALTAREFGQVVVASVLRQTPLEVTVLVMLLLAALPTRNGIDVFAYIHQFYLPFILAPALVIVALSLKNADPLFLQPILGNQPAGMFPGMLTVAALFQGSFVHTLIIPSMRRPQKAWVAALWGLGISGALYVVIAMATLSVFGPELTKQFFWPTLELAKATSLPGAVLERLDAPFLILWVMAVFTTLLSSYYVTAYGMSRLFNLQDHRLFSWFILPFVFVLAMLPGNIHVLYDSIQWVGRAGLVPTILYPLLLLLVAALRGKRGASGGQQTTGQSS